MQKYRWAIFGIGKFSPSRGAASAIAYAHAEAIKRNPDFFELTAVASRTVKQFSEQKGIGIMNKTCRNITDDLCERTAFDRREFMFHKKNPGGLKI